MKHVHYDEVYALEGRGTVYSGEDGAPFRAGDVVYVPPGEVHHYLIPKSGK